MAEVKEAPRPKTEVAKGQDQGQDQASAVARRPAAGDGNPLTFMRKFAEEMDRVFEDYGLRMPGLFGRGREMLLRETGLIPADWSPRVDVREREGQFVVHADLPGLSKDDVEVHVTDDMITIRGERKQEKKEEREGYAYSECNYGSFYRAIPLPEGVESSKATADFRDGVLEIAIPSPRRAAPQARRLEIRDKK